MKFWRYVGNGTSYQWLNFGVIRKESWILDHFEIFVTIAFNGAQKTAAKPKMVLPPSEQHCLGGGVRALTAF